MRLPRPAASIASIASIALLVGCAGGGGETTPSPTASIDPVQTLSLTSPAFEDGEEIPERFTCFGGGEVPPLELADVPARATSLALTVRDPDAPDGDFIHWVVYDLPTDTTRIPDLPAGTKQGTNSAGLVGWVPPCPPSGTHRYHFTLFALESPVEAVITEDVLEDIDRLTVASARVTGLVTSQFEEDPTATPDPTRTGDGSDGAGGAATPTPDGE